MTTPTLTTPDPDLTGIDPADIKTCQRKDCGKTFVRPTSKSRDQFADRKYCSRVCGGASQSLPLMEKTCEPCGQKFQRRPREAKDKFKRRETCSIVCGQKLAAKRRSLQQPLPKCALPNCDVTVARSDATYCSRAHSNKHRQTRDTCRRGKHPRPEGRKCEPCARERGDDTPAQPKPKPKPPKPKPGDKTVFGRPVDDKPWRPDGWTSSPMTSVPSQAWFQYDQPAGPQPKPADREVAA